MYLSVPYNYTAKGIEPIPLLRVLFALGLLNSLVLDYYLRHLTQINMSKIYLMQLPMPQPTLAQILATPSYLQVAKLALECQLFYDHQAHFTDLLRATKKPQGGIYEDLHALAPLSVPKTPEQLIQKRAALDILIATKIYPLTPEQFRHILSTFSVLGKKNEGFVRALEEELRGVKNLGVKDLD